MLRHFKIRPQTSAESERDRFMDRPMAITFGLYALFAVTYSYFQVKGDALVYYNLLRRFFGESPDFAYSYQHGSAVWYTPFFLIGKGFGAVFGVQPRTFHVTFQEISMTIAAQVAFVVIMYLGWLILKELDLPRGPGVLFLTVFGTPLFYYVTFDPAGKHVVDTLVLTAATYTALRLRREPGVLVAVSLGALCGWSLNIRWVNGAFFVILAIMLFPRARVRDATLATLSAVTAAAVIFLLPALRGIDYYLPFISPHTPVRIAMAATIEPPFSVAIAIPDPSELYFDPLIPTKMLFSEHRGLFLWTPLTALAVLGFLLALFRERRGGAHLWFVATLLLASISLLAAHTLWPHWDGGFAFSQRFLTGLFPLYLIGVAELVRRMRRVVYPLLTMAAGFAVAIAFVHDIGFDGISQKDGIARHIEAGWDNRRQMRLDVQDDGKQRWGYLWGLLQGRDTACIHEPPGTTDC